MKPKTKLQVRIMGLSNKLAPLRAKHKNWAKHLHKSYVTKSYSKLFCLECGHSWKYDLQEWTMTVIDHHCPECKLELTPIENAPIFNEFDIFSIVTAVEEFQVIRYFTIWKRMKKNEIPTYNTVELFQEWDDYKMKKKVVVGLNKTGYGYNSDGFSYGTNFDIKDPYDDYGSYRYSVFPSGIYPEVSVIPQITRNGFDGDFHGCNPRRLFDSILKYSIPETLLKLKESQLLSFYINKREGPIEQYWKQIKICFKHGYKITDFSIWSDYLDMLVSQKKDINNPKFICPENLMTAHNEIMVQKQIAREKKDAEQKLIRDEIDKKKRESEAMALKLKKKYFKDFTFSNKLITVKVLMTAEEMKEEGIKLFHCLHKNGYHKKKDSLILSARINEEPIETIEISLSRLSIIQSRGYDNEPTEHHNKIVKLVTKNLPKIQQLINKQKTESQPKKKTVKTPKLCQTA